MDGDRTKELNGNWKDISPRVSDVINGMLESILEWHRAGRPDGRISICTKVNGEELAVCAAGDQVKGTFGDSPDMFYDMDDCDWTGDLYSELMQAVEDGCDSRITGRWRTAC